MSQYEEQESRRWEKGMRTVIPPTEILDMRHAPSLNIPFPTNRKLTRPRSVLLDLALKLHPHPLSFLARRRNVPLCPNFWWEVWMALFSPTFDEGSELDDGADEGKRGWWCRRGRRKQLIGE